MTQDNLVIVESPAKAKTIKKYLWAWFEVVASMWHITDLEKWNNAIDKENDFAPTYIVSPDKKAVVTALRRAAKAMKRVWIATDEDREWEAIGWHLCRELKLDIAKTPRIVFHEITKDAIQHAVKNPRTLDVDLVDAQQARRVLDRLVWFDLSPVLWRKVKSGLSAWRVQSVAVKLLVEKEREVLWFAKKSQYKIKGTFLTKDKAILDAEVQKKLPNKEAVEKFVQWCAESTFSIADLEQTPGKKSPGAPFTTSSLQQAASTKLWFSVSRTMQYAQKLYEAGHITYMRTDSKNLSDQAIWSISTYVKNTYGQEYLKNRTFATKSKGAQQAHECIRPTRMDVSMAGADDYQRKLYHMIRQRTIASQMASAKVQKTTLTLTGSAIEVPFVAKGEVVTFEWFLKVFDARERGKESILPQVHVWDPVTRQEVVAHEQYTKPPARYTEASLVKKLEELGIGRPSTYAPTISTIQRRGYVEPWIAEWTPTVHHILTLVDTSLTWSQETKNIWTTKGKLVPTSIGMVVTDFLNEHFSQIMEYQFTANVEEQFDDIADGQLKWQAMIKKFYGPFHDRVEQVADGAERASGERVLGDDPKSWRPVSVRIGRYWPLVQIWSQWDENIKYASLPHGLNIETVTLEQAMEWFALPRELGEREEKMIKANIGRFGPYVQWGSVFASIKLPDDPYKIEYDRALELVKEKIQKDKEKTLQEFTYDDKPGVVMKARRSHVIKWNRKTIKLAKTVDGAELTQSQIEDIIQQEAGAKKKKPKKKGAKKKAPAKKKPAKKKVKKTPAKAK